MTTILKQEKHFLWKIVTTLIIAMIIGAGSILWSTQTSQAEVNVRLDTIEADIELFRLRIEHTEDSKLDKTSFSEMWNQVYLKLNSIDDKLYDMNQRLPAKK